MDKLPKGCRLTIVSDSCHSGGLISDAKEQIGESTKQNREDDGFGFGFKHLLRRSVEEAIKSRGLKIGHHQQQEDHQGEVDGYVKNKSLQLPLLIELLKQKTGKDDIDVGKLRPTLFDAFGDDASPKIKKFMKVIFGKLTGHHDKGDGGGFLDMMGSLAQQFLAQKLQEHDEDYVKPALQAHVGSNQEVYAGAAKKGLQDAGILISGCQTDQTSADTNPSGAGSHSKADTEETGLHAAARTVLQ